ncbi:MAG TPA: response regulator [Candidatus Cybelea sp.]|jgi:CheY-like chemotaxis protein|nr:response regulator [Candidatus Cybelea sp.]
MAVDASKQKCAVLLADDCDDDRFFIRKAIDENARLAIVGEVQDGEEAIAYLSGKGDFGNRQQHPFPDVLLLDLKMPRKTGHEVLEWLQTQSFKQLKVIVISGSVLPDDIVKSSALGADCYLKKSSLREEQAAMVREIEAVCNRPRDPSGFRVMT